MEGSLLVKLLVGRLEQRIEAYSGCMEINDENTIWLKYEKSRSLICMG